MLTHLWQWGRNVSDVSLLCSQQYNNIPLRQTAVHCKYVELHLLHIKTESILIPHKILNAKYL